MKRILQRKLLIQAFALIVGLFGVYWGTTELPALRNDRVLKSIAARIIEGDPFKPETLRSQSSRVEQAEKFGVCRPAARRGAALMQLRLAETDTAPDPAGARLDTALTSIRGSLACSPVDPFFWFALYVSQGRGPLSFLRESYRLAPNEGWIVIKRNPEAFAKFEYLPESLQQAALREFSGTLDMGFYDQAFVTLMGPAWKYRELIWTQLDGAWIRHRKAIAARLGVDERSLREATIKPPAR